MFSTSMMSLLLARAGSRLKTFKSDEDSPLHKALQQENAEEAIALFCKDTRCTQDLLNKKDITGRTPLMLAFEMFKLACVKLQLTRPGTKFYITDIQGDTLLHTALKKRNCDEIFSFICKDARCTQGLLNKKDISGRTH